MEFVDTHAHLHLESYKLDADKVLEDAKAAGVSRVICVGTTLGDSEKAIQFASSRQAVWASVGVHPHDAQTFGADSQGHITKLEELSKKSKVIAIGETGLDYYRSKSSKQDQESALRAQLALAAAGGLPVILHVREAWPDFWRILDDYGRLPGVIHSFSAHPKQVEAALSRDLYVGLNGIMTFTNDKLQLEAAKRIPLEKLLIETDAPFLTPTPFRGTICESKHVRVTAEFLADLRGESLEKLGEMTTKNAIDLFRLT